MDDAELSQRFAAIEAQLVLISQHLGVSCPAFASTAFRPPAAFGGHGSPPPPGANPMMPAYQLEVIALLRAGEKIKAIKAFREATGCSLIEAKEAVERLE